LTKVRAKNCRLQTETILGQSLRIVYMKKVSLISIISLLAIYAAFFTSQARAVVPELSSGMTTLSVPIGNYLVLNGGYAKLERQNILSPSGFSFETWVNPDSTNDRQIILSVGDKNQDHFNYEIGVNGGSFFIHYYYGEGSQRLVNAGQILKNVWNHVAVSISGSSTVLFVNGKAIYTALGTESLKPVSGNIILGTSYSENTPTANYFKGLIDEVRISLVSRNIADLWNNGVYESSLNPDPDTLLLWHFDQTRGETTIIDSSPNPQNASLIGGDGKIHFFGVLPSPTPFNYNLRVLPTLDLRRVRFIGPPIPAISPTPVIDPENPTPTPADSIRFLPRGQRRI